MTRSSPKILFRFLLDTRLETRVPIWAPTITPMLRRIVYPNWTFPRYRWVVTAEIDVKIIVKTDVATAMCIGKERAKCNIGTMRAPPPKPSKPEEIPAKKLKGNPNLMLVVYLNALPSESMRWRAHPVLGLLEDLVPKLYENIIREATYSRKRARITISSSLEIFSVKIAPKKAPGMVIVARSNPTL